MDSRIPKYVGFTLLAILLAAVLGLGALYVRLTQGPLAAGFITSRVEQALNAQFPDVQLTLGDATIALNPETRIPSVSFKNVAMSDQRGNLVASVPEAAVTLSLSDLLAGSIRAKSLDVYGPAILARRNADGTLILGFNPPDSQQDSGQAQPEQASGAAILNLLDAHDNANTIASLDSIRISNAAMRFYDDGNAATWVAPHIDMVFQKRPDGFIVVARGDVAAGDKSWHTEISALYHHDDGRFEVSSTIDGIVPATAARKIYALSQFAALSTPLSGHADFTINRAGQLVAAKGEFRAAKGQVTLPQYFAEPINIDEGQFNVAFKPETGAFEINDSTLRLSGRVVDLNGAVTPQRGPDGKLSELDIKLATEAQGNAAPEADGVIDHVEFAGRAAIDKARLDIDDLVVLSGSNGLRMRGNVAGGERSPAIHLAGRLRDVNLNLLRVLWPPIIAPRSRAWIFENVQAGSIPEGSFQVNFAENQLAEAHDNKRNPDGSIDFRFTMKDVDTHYYKSMPDAVGTSGQAQLIDNSFALDIASGTSTLASGDVIKLNSGRFSVDDVAQQELTGHFTFDLNAPLSAMLAVASNPDIKMIKADALAGLPKAQGQGHIKIDLTMPMIANPPKERVQVKTAVDTSGVTISGLAPGADLTDGSFAISFGQDRIDISGPAKLNGQPAKLQWSKVQGAEAKAQINATLDEKSRDKLGLKINDYVQGPIDVEALLSKDKDGSDVLDITADLSKATLKVGTLGWKRLPSDGTLAAFRLISNDQGRSVQDFKLDGDGLTLRGAFDLTKDGKIKLLNMSQIKLDEDTVFSVRAIPGDDTTDITISGTKLDARPYIKTVLSPPKKGEGAASGSGNTQDFTLHAHFDQVIANRGESLSNVSANLRARGGRIAEATIQGTFLTGQNILATVVPLPDGRQMHVKSTDAGSTLRAADLYSKVAGGNLDFQALIGNEEGSPLRDGLLAVRDFQVRNEAALAELDKRGKPTGAGPRSEAVAFTTLILPFSGDDQFIRFKDGSVKGPSLCATADGVVRKADNALDISGTVVPACGLSRAFNGLPLLGDILSGGNLNEGIFGVTYNVAGTFAAPQIKMNPLSALAPGVFRRLFDFNPKPAQ